MQCGSNGKPSAPILTQLQRLVGHLSWMTRHAVNSPGKKPGVATSEFKDLLHNCIELITAAPRLPSTLTHIH